MSSCIDSMLLTPPSSPKKAPVCPDAPKKPNVVPYASYQSWNHFSKKVSWSHFSDGRRM